MNELQLFLEKLNNNFINPFQFWLEFIIGLAFVLSIILRQYFFNTPKFTFIFNSLYFFVIINILGISRFYFIENSFSSFSIYFLVIMNIIGLGFIYKGYKEYKINTK
jgi:L-asparagine transporter-like permease